MERAGIVLEVAQQASITITLEVGAISETVKITAQAPLLEASSAAIGEVVDNEHIVNLPMNQRNPYALVFNAPGVVGNVNAEFNQSNISINGGRPGSNEILVDGIPSSPPLVNPIQGFTVYPSVDAVQEFRVQTSSYEAEFGRSGGGIINLIYKTGTNNLHGASSNSSAIPSSMPTTSLTTKTVSRWPASNGTSSESAPAVPWKFPRSIAAATRHSSSPITRVCGSARKPT